MNYITEKDKERLVASLLTFADHFKEYCNPEQLRLLEEIKEVFKDLSIIDDSTNITLFFELEYEDNINKADRTNNDIIRMFWSVDIDGTLDVSKMVTTRLHDIHFEYPKEVGLSYILKNNKIINWHNLDVWCSDIEYFKSFQIKEYTIDIEIIKK